MYYYTQQVTPVGAPSHWQLQAAKKCVRAHRHFVWVCLWASTRVNTHLHLSWNPGLLPLVQMETLTTSKTEEVMLLLSRKQRLLCR